MNGNMEEDNKSVCSMNSDEDTVKKKTKRGIIYLSTIPPYMNVIRIREFFQDFGKVGNVYLQLADAGSLLLFTWFRPIQAPLWSSWSTPISYPTATMNGKI